MRTITLAAAALCALTVAGCSNHSSTPPPASQAPVAPSTATATTPTLTGDDASVAAVKAAAPRLRSANGIIKGCLIEATPACVDAASDGSAAAAGLVDALGHAPGETATVMSAVTILSASLRLLVEDVVTYQTKQSSDNWGQVVLAVSGVVDTLDMDWAARGA